MTAHDEPSPRLEQALGALADWLDSVRVHETDRRARIAAEERARRDHGTIVVMAFLSAATLAFFFWLSHR